VKVWLLVAVMFNCLQHILQVLFLPCHCDKVGCELDAIGCWILVVTGSISLSDV
jgi:hypothetical protein